MFGKRLLNSWLTGLLLIYLQKFNKVVLPEPELPIRIKLKGASYHIIARSIKVFSKYYS